MLENKTKVLTLDITDFVKRLIEINRKANDYEYEDLFKSPIEDAKKELEDILNKKISQWEYEVRYDVKKKGQNQ